MNVGRVASLYIKGLEAFSLSSGMVFTLTFKESIQYSTLANSFNKLIRDHKALRVSFQRDGDRFRWAALSDFEIETALSTQQELLQSLCYSQTRVASFRARSVLPIVLIPRNDFQVAMQVDHAFANGVSALYWLQRLLSIHEGRQVDGLTPHERSRRRLQRRFGLLTDLLGLSCYVGKFLIDAGLHAGTKTVDLTNGRKPHSGNTDYVLNTYTFTKAQTDRLRQKCRECNTSVTQAIALAFTSSLFASQTRKSRVCISIPTDLGGPLRIPPSVPGNYTGGFVVQLTRSATIRSQLRRQFRWIHWNVDFTLPWIVGLLTRNEKELCKKFSETAAMPIPKRAPFENLSCAISNLGVIQHPEIERNLAGISAHMRTQTIFVCAMTLNDCISIEITAPDDLYDREDVVAVSEGAVAILLT